MESRIEPLSSRQRKELEGYVSLPVTLGRSFLFVCAVALMGGFLWRAVNDAPVVSQWDHRWTCWFAATAFAAIVLYVKGGNWTGGSALRGKIRKDLEEGAAEVTTVRAIDAIVIEEREDEGPAIFIRTDAATFLFAGQYLERSVRRGFPWTEFEIWEAPNSKVFFDLKRVGEKLRPTAFRGPLSRAEFELLGDSRYRTVDIEFDQLLHKSSKFPAHSQSNDSNDK